jgi:putative membrane protein
MIVRDHLPLQQVWPLVAHRLVLLCLFDLAIAALYTFGDMKMLALSGLPLTTMGSAIGIFLAFRTNSAYERWWEARILWGGLVNASRTLARQALTLIDREGNTTVPSALQRRLLQLQLGFITAVRCHLRRQNPFPELRAFLGPNLTEELRDHNNVPSALLLKKGYLLQEAKEEGLITDFRWVQMDKTLTEMTTLLGSCERIKGTPLPRQYDFFPRVLVTVYCLLLPFGFVEGMGMLTPLASTLVSFIFIALDTVGRDIEAPFENTVHDTPLTSISRTIEINLRQLFGDCDVPPEVEAVDGFLY